ncbi:G-protein coupled receptors family 1 profile domain-containing protein [Caenorhabditis elegans]|uniref:G-protein coupled receptors family 1 profile domain-containing protein n=1 Tax=Caenorhabditis elegans TaxID=6239 RepID=O44986_CAEEL|nr:G-protein coupled receptors family 1 profile domain-containing protein [Caenorhabditis elegans]CCD68630.1 G-protein coupled receptors family 1 profile domain-containing protein [Caenorhabditis elegans]|eukprot:NP_491954.1 SERotonin/octopamine receptor family [Caenorhabditis elegans]
MEWMRNTLNGQFIAENSDFLSENTTTTTLGFTPITEESPNCSFYEWSRNPSHAQFFRIFSIISVLTVLVVVVVLGNALVIAAVLLRRRLRSATGLLILSLALADLLVGTVILPFSIANEVLDQYWIFGETWCTIWLTLDIWMCTASIYNLVAISIDRYIAIIKPLNYPMLVTKFRARCTVAIVWIGSFLICSPSFFLASSIKDKETPCRCTPANAGRVYVVFSASSSFYIPMIIVVFVYFRIYVAARAATKSIYSGMMSVTAAANKKQNPKSYLLNHPDVINKDSLPMLRVHRGSSVVAQITPNKPYNTCRQNGNSIDATANGTSQITAAATKARKFANDSAKTLVNRGAVGATQQAPIGARFKRHGRDSESSVDSMNGTNSYSATPHKSGNEELGSLIENSRSSSTDSNEKTEQLTNQTDDNFSMSNNNNNGDEKEAFDESLLSESKKKSKSLASKFNHLMRRGQKKRTAGAYEKRLSLEIKAAKTVAIVTGCFIFCWLGFALVYGLEIKLNDVVWSIVFWLGYLNSALNPVIYTVFNREFRICFKRLLTCHHLNHPTQKYTNNNSYNSTAIRSTNAVNRVPQTSLGNYTQTQNSEKSSAAVTFNTPTN